MSGGFPQLLHYLCLTANPSIFAKATTGRWPGGRATNKSGVFFLLNFA
jgi:hypothetical protein